MDPLLPDSTVDEPVREEETEPVVEPRIKVSIPDSEIPESRNKNWLNKQIIVDQETGLRFKWIKGKKIFIEKWQ